jgi:hypothetical protein
MKQLSKAQMNQLRESAKQRESSGRYAVVNKSGFTGAYQFGLSALEDLGYIKVGTTARLDAANEQAELGNGKYVSRNSGLTNAANWTGKDGMSNVQAFKDNKELQDKAFDRRINSSIKDLTQRGVITDASTAEEIAGNAFAAHLIGAKGLATKGLEGTDGNKTKAREYFKIAGQAINGVPYDKQRLRQEGAKQSPAGNVYNTDKDRVAAGNKPPPAPKVARTIPMGVRPDDESGIKTLQKMVGAKADGKWGPNSQAKYDNWYEANVNAENNSARMQSFDVNQGSNFDVNQSTRFSPNPGTQRAYGNAPFPGLQPPQPAPEYRDDRRSPNPGTQRVYGNAPVPGLQQVEPSLFANELLAPPEFSPPTTGLIDSYGNPVLDGSGMPIQTRF